MPYWLELDRVTMPLVRQLHEIWQAKRTGTALPRRADFDPLDLKSVLPNLMIVEPEPEPFRLRYRLVGTKIARVSGFDFTGRYLDEILRPGLPDDWHHYYRVSYENRRPVYGLINSPTRDGDSFIYEFGIFPLRLGGDRVEQFFSLEDFGGREPYSNQLVGERQRDTGLRDAGQDHTDQGASRAAAEGSQ
ncbi:MAG TPA: PAS domain-containing protein [Dongiaceae bacterium]|nr:PAS domain-containing protein [Dongiaceae bacterium]